MAESGYVVFCQARDGWPYVRWAVEVGEESTSRSRTARAAAAVREVTPSLAKRLEVCVVTVRRLTNSASAISRGLAGHQQAQDRQFAGRKAVVVGLRRGGGSGGVSRRVRLGQRQIQWLRAAGREFLGEPRIADDVEDRGADAIGLVAER